MNQLTKTTYDSAKQGDHCCIFDKVLHSSIFHFLKEGEAAQRLSGAAVQLGVNAEEEVTAKRTKITTSTDKEQSQMITMNLNQNKQMGSSRWGKEQFALRSTWATNSGHTRCQKCSSVYKQQQQESKSEMFWPYQVSKVYLS